MIASPNASPETMLRALAYTLAALIAAANLDVDRTPEDRAFFTNEATTITEIKDKLLAATQALLTHTLNETMRLQAQVTFGDIALDRGARDTKAQMNRGLKNQMADGADVVFGSNIEDLVGAELRSEPALVKQSIARSVHVPDFPGKEQLLADLTARAERQEQALADRDASNMTRSLLSSTVVRLVADGSDALYRLDKLLLGRFTRDRIYVRRFFLDTASPKKPKEDTGSAE